MPRRPKPTPPAAWIKPGALADFRMVAGEPVTHAACRILSEPWQLGSGDWLVKIEGVAGGVSCEPRFLTPAKVPPSERLSFSMTVQVGGRAPLHFEGRSRVELDRALDAAAAEIGTGVNRG
jgi:hypothetical protein